MSLFLKHPVPLSSLFRKWRKLKKGGDLPMREVLVAQQALLEQHSAALHRLERLCAQVAEGEGDEKEAGVRNEQLEAGPLR